MIQEKTDIWYKRKLINDVRENELMIQEKTDKLCKRKLINNTGKNWHIFTKPRELRATRQFWHGYLVNFLQTWYPIEKFQVLSLKLVGEINI